MTAAVDRNEGGREPVGRTPIASPASPKGSSSAQIAKATLLRLAQSRLEPTPENYARAWIEAGGGGRTVDATDQAWTTLLDQLVRGLDRGHKQWTPARKKDSLQRVIDGSRSHPQRLRERLSQLVASWEHDSVDAPIVPGAADDPAHATLPKDNWPSLAAELNTTVRAALPEGDAKAGSVSRALAEQAVRLRSEGAHGAIAREVQTACAEARRVFAQRHHLVDELGKLVQSLAGGLTELAEDESWARGQAEALRARLDGESLTVRGVRSAVDLLTQTRLHQQRLRGERDRARAALRALVESLSAELDSLGGQTGRFSEALVRSTEELERADSREQMSEALVEMLNASRQVQTEVADASARIAANRSQADTLTARVHELEGQLRRLSDEASTDALTQVANRRGLTQAFEAEAARHARDGSALAVGLIDIDNFKKLNDSLGHAVGDEALKALAAQVRDALRPVDHVARFGGEEFVVLLPATALEEGCEVLTRVQRGMSMGLFMHEGREVFVTFSAGVTAWRVGEPLDAALERADAALYEAKRTGKNRTCTA
jgi:diguanylate cyclase